MIAKPLRIGIVGGGQLGRMTLQEALSWNLEIAVLDNDPHAPCSKLAKPFVVGSLLDYQTVLEFGRTCDIVTIEIEHVNTAALKQLAAEGIKVFPQPEIIELVQDKGLQKQFFSENQLPTAAFQLLENPHLLASEKVSFPCVLKLRKGGYDGKGVQVIHDAGKWSEAFNAPSVLEEKVPFRKEIAVIVSRNEKGETAAFPMVEMEFNPEANLVEFLYAPSPEKESIQEAAHSIALNLITKLNMVGVLAVEMFLTHDDRILVNEIAPRSHNSGHHTIEANDTSQFMQHIRSICGLSPGSTQSRFPAAMLNVLGEEGYSGKAVYLGWEDVLKVPGVYVHLYGKTHTKPFRKMGHITVTDTTLDNLFKKVAEVKGKLRVIAE